MKQYKFKIAPRLLGMKDIINYTHLQEYQILTIQIKQMIKTTRHQKD